MTASSAAGELFRLKGEVRCLKTALESIASPPADADANFAQRLAHEVLALLARKATQPDAWSGELPPATRAQAQTAADVRRTDDGPDLRRSSVGRGSEDGSTQLALPEPYAYIGIHVDDGISVEDEDGPLTVRVWTEAQIHEAFVVARAQAREDGRG